MTNNQLKQTYELVPIMKVEEYTECLKMLGEKTRYLIAREIINNPGISGKELLVKFHITQPTLSFHIRQLMRVHFIFEKRDGQRHMYFPNYEVIISFTKTTVGNKTNILNSVVKDSFIFFKNVSLDEEK